jgi:hypothetical protein
MIFSFHFNVYDIACLCDTCSFTLVKKKCLSSLLELYKIQQNCVFAVAMQHSDLYSVYVL